MSRSRHLMKIAGRCQHSILQSVFRYLLPLHAQNYHVCLEQSDYYNSGIWSVLKGAIQFTMGVRGLVSRRIDGLSKDW